MLPAWTLTGRRSLWTLQIFIFYLDLWRKRSISQRYPSFKHFPNNSSYSVIVERVDSKEGVPKFSRSILAVSYGQRCALCSNNPANVKVSVKLVKVEKGYKEIDSPFTCCLVNREYSWKGNYALQHVGTHSRCMCIWMKIV